MTQMLDPAPADFSQAPPRQKADTISRPSLSYWQDAWLRLRRNKRALTSLYLICCLLVFTLLGPLVWTYDYTLQDLDSISQTPTFGTTALVVADPGLWEGVTLQDSTPLATAPAQAELGATSIYVEGIPTTQYVRLSWDPVPGAAYYLIYRNDHRPESPEDLGLPLPQRRHVARGAQRAADQALDLDGAAALLALGRLASDALG